MVDKIPTMTTQIGINDMMTRTGQNYKINKRIWELIEGAQQEPEQEETEQKNLVTVIFHATSSIVESINNQGGFLWDYEGSDPETGDAIGTLISPNNENDYVIENVEIGTQHIVYPNITTEPASSPGSKNINFEINENNHVFTILETL